MEPGITPGSYCLKEGRGYMLVKEFLSGEKMPKDKLYQVEMPGPRGGKSRKVYFLSQEAYEGWTTEEFYRRSFIDNLVKDYGYVSGMPVPSIIFAKLKELKSFGYEAVYNTYENMKNYIYQTVAEKHFSNESAMFSYIMAIIRNNVMTEYRKIQKREKLKAESKQKSVVEPSINLDDIKPKEKAKDLSSLLGDI